MGSDRGDNHTNFFDTFDLGDRIRVITPSGCDTGFFIAFQGNTLIWGREDDGEAVLAYTDLSAATVEKI